MEHGTKGEWAMSGLKRVTKQNRFRNKAVAVSRKVLDEQDVGFYVEKRPDDAFEDDGTLHVIKYGIRAVFSIGQDTPGRESNEKTRAILAALGMKRKIGKNTLVAEECETCDGSGYVECSEHGEHGCNDCDGGLVEPEDYK